VKSARCYCINGSTLHRSGIYRRNLFDRSDADRRRETCRIGLRNLVWRQRCHGCILLRKTRNLPELLATVADDWLGRMFLDMAAEYGILVHPRKVKTSSLSFVMPNNGQRAIVRCRDDDYLNPFPRLNLSGCRALHVDGHQADAAMYYAKAAREAGMLTSLDGGGLRSNTHELLSFIEVAIASERLCEQMAFEPTGMLEYLKSRGCRIGGVTLGQRGLVWYDEADRSNAASCCRTGGSRYRYERCRRRLPRRLCLFLSRRCGKILGGALPFCSRCRHPQDPVSR